MTSMTKHAVVIAGGGPTGLMLAGELALAGIDVAIVERRATQALPGSRAGGLHARTLEVLDQRGIVDRFLALGKVMQVAGFALIPLDISDAPTRHAHGLALWQEPIERALATWVDELAVPVQRGLEVTSFVQDEGGVDVELSDGRTLRAQYLVGCDGGRSLIRRHAGIEFPGSEPSISYLIAEVAMTAEPPWGIRRDARGINGLGKLDDGTRVRAVLNEPEVRHGDAPTLDDLRAALVALYGTDFGVHDATRVRAVLNEPEVRHGDERTKALHRIMATMLAMDEPRRRYGAMLSGLDIHYDLGPGHPLLGRRMPDLDVVSADGPRRVFGLLRTARPILLELGEPGVLDIAAWADRVERVAARHDGAWALPVLGAVAPPSAVLIRPDGHVAWVGEGTDHGLREALTTWFGPALPG